jgi:hypothetical protein
MAQPILTRTLEIISEFRASGTVEYANTPRSPNFMMPTDLFVNQPGRFASQRAEHSAASDIDGV